MDHRVNRLDRYKLKTDFPDEQTVVHTTIKSNLTARQRRIEVKEIWKREKELGAGAFGSVWREKEKAGQLRAVKILPKVVLNAMRVDYVRELEVLVELSDVSTKNQ